MSGATTELNLRTAVDADDTADYLTLDLANSLRTVDALFNNVTGHNHQSAHQGGPLTVGTSNLADGSITSAKIADGSIATVDLADGSVTSAKLSPPIDINGWFRTTGHPAAFATTGVGLELYYDATGLRGIMQTRDAGAGTYGDMAILGKSVTLAIPSGAAVILASDGNLEVSQAIVLGSSQPAPAPITWRSASTAGIPNLIVDGTLTVPNITLTGALNAPNATVSTLTVTGTLTSSGATNLAGLSIGSATMTSNAVNLQTGNSFIIGGSAVLYLGSDKVVHIDRGTGVITASHTFAAPGLTSTSDLNVTGNMAISGQIQPGGSGAGVILGQAGTGNVEINSTLTVNTANANAKTFFVNGAAGGTTTWAQVSMREYKQDAVAIPDPLRLLLDDRLHGILYTPAKVIANPMDASSQRYGFEAEAWYDVAPQVVQLGENRQPVSMGYAEVGAITWEGLKVLAGQVNALLERVAALEGI